MTNRMKRRNGKVLKVSTLSPTRSLEYREVKKTKKSREVKIKNLAGKKKIKQEKQKLSVNPASR